MSLKSFEDLKAWQVCDELRRWVKRLIKTWPKEEQYDLIDQTRRSARSSCSNIAEGYGRNHSKDNARFLRNSIGSLWETLDHLIDAHDSEYITDDDLLFGRQIIDKALKLVQGYKRYLLSNDQLREPHAEYITDPFLNAKIEEEE